MTEREELTLVRILQAVVNAPESAILSWIRNGQLMTELEKLAFSRVLRAGVKAQDSAILSWIRSIGPETILVGKLCDIRAVANAF